MTMLKLFPVALLMMAGVIGSPHALASPPATEDLKVTFTYSIDAPASDIYARLETTARNACRSPGVRSLQQQMQEKACARRLLSAAVTRIGRADIAQVHLRNPPGPFASAG